MNLSPVEPGVLEGLEHRAVVVALYAADIPERERYPRHEELSSMIRQGLARLGGVKRAREVASEMLHWDHLWLVGVLSTSAHEILISSRLPNGDRATWCFGLAEHWLALRSEG